jgi:hypothetical protein
MKTLKVHPNTNGGRTVLFAQQLWEDNPKDNRFLVTTIYKGLGLDVSFLNVDKIVVKESFVRVGDLNSPLLVVTI